MINPDGVRHQIHGNVIQSVSRVLKESVGFSATAVEAREWGAYPILAFPEVPAIDVVMMPRPDEPPLGAGESASVPSAAAIANALFDATGVRFRELPLTPERVRAALNPLPPPATPRPVAAKPWWRRVFPPIAGVFAGGLALGTLAFPWRPPMAPIARPSPDVFSAATIARGRLAAAAGACNVCHAGLDGAAFAGGRPLETPFGTVTATNISPDVATGIGAWSYPAFARAMRAGVSRDGHHLYPAHPYTAFAKADEGDIQALYAYLMAQPAVAFAPPKTRLRFPFNLRMLMAGWNALFLEATPAPADPARDAAWNRGAYLVETLGHCGACHTARNALGAEKTGPAHLAGGFADGWHAPALDGTGKSPVAWTLEALTAYLRTGHAADHGPAAGPMADVVAALRPLPDDDILAMATYLAGLNPVAPTEADAAAAARDALARSTEAAAPSRLLAPKGARLFEGACGACHGDASSLTSLALAGNLHAATPVNAIRAVLDGVASPTVLRGLAAADVAAMPSFAASLGDADIAELLRFARARFAPGEPAWAGLDDAIAAARH